MRESEADSFVSCGTKMLEENIARGRAISLADGHERTAGMSEAKFGRHLPFCATPGLPCHMNGVSEAPTASDYRDGRLLADDHTHAENEAAARLQCARVNRAVTRDSGVMLAGSPRDFVAETHSAASILGAILDSDARRVRDTHSRCDSNKPSKKKRRRVTGQELVLHPLGNGDANLSVFQAQCSAAISTCAFNVDDSLLAVASAGGDLYVVRTSDWEFLHKHRLAAAVTSVVVARTAHNLDIVIASVAEHRVQGSRSLGSDIIGISGLAGDILWQIKTTDGSYSEMHLGYAHECFEVSNSNGTIAEHNSATGRENAVLIVLSTAPLCFAQHLPASRFATADLRCCIRSFSRDGDPRHRRSSTTLGTPVTALSYSPCGFVIAAGLGNGIVLVLSSVTLSVLHELRYVKLGSPAAHVTNSVVDGPGATATVLSQSVLLVYHHTTCECGTGLLECYRLLMTNPLLRSFQGPCHLCPSVGA